MPEKRREKTIKHTINNGRLNEMRAPCLINVQCARSNLFQRRFYSIKLTAGPETLENEMQMTYMT